MTKRLRSIFFFIFLILIILALIYVFPNVSAFSVVSNMTTNTVCPSSTIVFEEVITASTSGPFTITIEGTAATFTTTVPTGFWLEAGQVQSVYSYITPSSKVVPGSYRLEITIEKNGEIKTVRHDIIVENCHNTVLSIEPETQKICACEEKKIILNINNKGNYLENYQIKIEGPATDWVTLSSESVTLASCTDIDIEVYINTPCDVHGTYNFNFIVTSQSPYAQATKTATIDVVSCYDYTISSEKVYYSICDAQDLIIPLSIKNLGTANNIYKINMYGPSWTRIDQKTLTVTVGETRTFNLIAKPPFMTEGSFPVTLEFLSEYGKVMKEYELSIDVEKCYGVYVYIEESEDRMCNALSNTYGVVIKNTGKYKNSFDISLSGPKWATISERHIVLEADEEQSFVLDVHPPYKTEGGKYDFIVKAKDPISGVEAQDSIAITSITTEECYKPAISTKDDIVKVGRDGTCTAIFIVENKGSRSANYNIEISGTATGFSQINPGAIEIKPLEAQTLYLYIAPSPEIQLDNYTLTITARLEDTTILASKTITISVVEGEELLLTLPLELEEEKEIDWYKKFFRWFVNLFKPKQLPKENITEEQEMEKEEIIEEKENQPPVLKTDIPDFEIEAGQTYELDLSEYFEDPDEDELSFITVKPLNIDISIIGSVVKLTPQLDFEGTREVVFYASDGEEIAESNSLIITVTGAIIKEEIETNETEVNETEVETNETETNETLNETEIETGNETLNETEIETVEIVGEEQEVSESTGNFVSKYKGFMIAGVIILLIIIILLTGIGKKIIDFFEEEVSVNRNNKKK